LALVGLIFLLPSAFRFRIHLWCSGTEGNWTYGETDINSVTRKCFIWFVSSCSLIGCWCPQRPKTKWLVAKCWGERHYCGSGSNCDMNAVFLQLFHTFPFRHAILSQKTTGESHGQLKRFFIELFVNQQSFCDILPLYKGSQSCDKMLIFLREQQDASEFPQR
jgi:hypothetical protein